jgi:hypothetical protein
MRRLISGSIVKASNGSKENNAPRPPLATGDGNGAPTADQKFLAELAAILLAEEEAKLQQAQVQDALQQLEPSEQNVQDHQGNQVEQASQQTPQVLNQPEPWSLFGDEQLGAGNMKVTTKQDGDAANTSNPDVAAFSSENCLQRMEPVLTSANSVVDNDCNVDGNQLGSTEEVGRPPSPGIGSRNTARNAGPENEPGESDQSEAVSATKDLSETTENVSPEKTESQGASHASANLPERSEEISSQGGSRDDEVNDTTDDQALQPHALPLQISEGSIAQVLRTSDAAENLIGPCQGAHANGMLEPITRLDVDLGSPTQSPPPDFDGKFSTTTVETGQAVQPEMEDYCQHQATAPNRDNQGSCEEQATIGNDRIPPALQTLSIATGGSERLEALVANESTPFDDATNNVYNIADEPHGPNDVHYAFRDGVIVAVDVVDDRAQPEVQITQSTPNTSYIEQNQSSQPGTPKTSATLEAEPHGAENNAKEYFGNVVSQGTTSESDGKGGLGEVAPDTSSLGDTNGLENDRTDLCNIHSALVPGQLDSNLVGSTIPEFDGQHQLESLSREMTEIPQTKQPNSPPQSLSLEATPNRRNETGETRVHNDTEQNDNKNDNVNVGFAPTTRNVKPVNVLTSFEDENTITEACVEDPEYRDQHASQVQTLSMLDAQVNSAMPPSRSTAQLLQGDHSNIQDNAIEDVPKADQHKGELNSAQTDADVHYSFGNTTLGRNYDQDSTTTRIKLENGTHNGATIAEFREGIESVATSMAVVYGDAISTTRIFNEETTYDASHDQISSVTSELPQAENLMGALELLVPGAANTAETELAIQIIDKEHSDFPKGDEATITKGYIRGDQLETNPFGGPITDELRDTTCPDVNPLLGDSPPDGTIGVPKADRFSGDETPGANSSHGLVIETATDLNAPQDVIHGIRGSQAEPQYADAPPESTVGQVFAARVEPPSGEIHQTAVGGSIDQPLTWLEGDKESSSPNKPNREMEAERSEPSSETSNLSQYDFESSCNQTYKREASFDSLAHHNEASICARKKDAPTEEQVGPSSTHMPMDHKPMDSEVVQVGATVPANSLADERLLVLIGAEEVADVSPTTTNSSPAPNCSDGPEDPLIMEPSAEWESEKVSLRAHVERETAALQNVSERDGGNPFDESEGASLEGHPAREGVPADLPPEEGATLVKHQNNRLESASTQVAVTEGDSLGKQPEKDTELEKLLSARAESQQTTQEQFPSGIEQPSGPGVLQPSKHLNQVNQVSAPPSNLLDDLRSNAQQVEALNSREGGSTSSVPESLSSNQAEGHFIDGDDADTVNEDAGGKDYRVSLDSDQQTDTNPGVSPGVRTSTSSSVDDALLGDFEVIKSSFLRLLAATSSTAATVSEATTPVLSSTAATVAEVTAPMRIEAVNVMTSSVTAASGIVDTCRRQIVKRRSERKSVVAFVQHEQLLHSLGNYRPNADEEFEDSVSKSVAMALSHDESEPSAVPPLLALSSTSDLDQYRKDLSTFLGDTPNRNHGEKGGITGQYQSLPSDRLDDKFDVARAARHEDPVLKAAVAGCERRRKQGKPETHIGPERYAVGATLKSIGDFTKATATALAATGLPSTTLEEAKIIADGISHAFGLQTQSEEEEETIVLCDDTTCESLASRAKGKKVFSASSAVLQRKPSASNVGAFSVPTRKENAPLLLTKREGLNEMGSKAASRPTYEGNSRSPRDIPLSLGIGVQSFSNHRLQDTWRHAKSAIENRGLLLEILSEKLRASGTEKAEPDRAEAGQHLRLQAGAIALDQNSLGGSSSVSSPASPALSSSSSSSDGDSQQNSMSTATTANTLVDPGVHFWDMVSSKKATTAAQSASIGLPSFLDLQQGVQPDRYKPDALSFDVVSPLPLPTEDRKSQGFEIAGRADGQEHLSIPFMETHVENAEESERSDRIIDSTSEGSETEQEKTDVSGEGGHSAWEKMSDSEEEETVATPLVYNLSDTPSSALLSQAQGQVAHSPRSGVEYSSRPSLAFKKQQTENFADHLQGLRSIQSADVADAGDNDSVSMAGYVSLPSTQPSTQFTENASEIIPNGSNRARERLRSPQNSVNWATNSFMNNSFSGSKRGLLSSRRHRSRRSLQRRGSRRLFKDDSMSQSLQEFSSAEGPASGVRRSPSGNNLLLLAGIEPGQRVALLPEMDDASGVEGVARVDLALLACSSIGHNNILEEMKTTIKSEPLQYLASVRWRQIISRWKHHSLAKAMLERPTSSHYRGEQEEDQEFLDEEESAFSTGAPQQAYAWLETLRKSHQHCRMISDTKNLNGMLPHLADGECKALSGFLVALGQEVVLGDGSGEKAKIAHIPQGTGGVVTAPALVDTAKTYLRAFSGMVSRMVHFAAKNHPAEDTSQKLEHQGSFSVGVKALDAIERKAIRKYGGDLLQVKDILRAQIVFEDEGTLASGLLYLFTACSSIENQQERGPIVEIVRVKNLFLTGVMGELCPSTLPTGYRHILVNVRLNGLFLAGMI